MPAMGRALGVCEPLPHFIDGTRAMHRKHLPKRGIVRAKSFVIALALTGISWNFAPQTGSAQSGSAGVVQEAGEAAHEARQSADDPVSPPPALAAWSIDPALSREPQPAQSNDRDAAATVGDGICAMLDRSAAD